MANVVKSLTPWACSVLTRCFSRSLPLVLGAGRAGETQEAASSLSRRRVRWATLTTSAWEDNIMGLQASVRRDSTSFSGRNTFQSTGSLLVF